MAAAKRSAALARRESLTAGSAASLSGSSASPRKMSPERQPVSPYLPSGGGEPRRGRLGNAGRESSVQRVDARGKVQLTQSADRARVPPGSAMHTPRLASRDRAEQSGIRTSEAVR